jgi:hypothetical protein
VSTNGCRAIKIWSLSGVQTAKARTGTNPDRKRGKEQDRLTTEQQKNVIGGVVLEYSEVKQKIAALEQDLRTTLATVHQVERAFNMQEREKIPELLKGWPTADYFTDTLNEIEEKRRRKAALEHTMKQYGIDL